MTTITFEVAPEEGPPLTVTCPVDMSVGAVMEETRIRLGRPNTLDLTAPDRFELNGSEVSPYQTIAGSPITDGATVALV